MRRQGLQPGRRGPVLSVLQGNPAGKRVLQPCAIAPVVALRGNVQDVREQKGDGTHLQRVFQALDDNGCRATTERDQEQQGSGPRLFAEGLDGAEVHELATVLKANKSLKTFKLDWRNMREEHKLWFLASKHRAIVRNMENFKFECEEGNVNVVRAFAQGGVCEKADAMVCACEKVSLEVVQALVEGHEVEGTWVTLDDVLNREGKNSSGESARPIDVAATALKFDIVVYLAGKGAKGEKFAGTPMVRACEKGDFDSVKAMVEGHDVEKTGMSVDEMLNREGKNPLVNHETLYYAPLDKFEV